MRILKYDIEKVTGIPWKKKKSYRYLYRLACREDVIKKAFKRMRKGKTKRKDFQMAEENLDAWVKKIQEIILNTKPDGWQTDPQKRFKPVKHNPVIIKEFGKTRVVYVPTMVELWIQHVIVMILEPIIAGSSYPMSFSSFPGRGSLKGQRAIRRWIESGKGIRNFAQADIRHFYSHIQYKIVRKKLERRVKDNFFLHLIDVCMTYFPKEMPLGFYLSQWLANFMLQELDYDIKCKLKIAHHVRYMDNYTLADDNKKKLHQALLYIRQVLGKMRLRMKSDWQVFRFEYTKKNGKKTGRCVSAMGWLFYRSKVLIRKRILLHVERIARKLHKKEENGQRFPLGLCRGFVSLLGWITHSETYDWYLIHIKELVNVRKIKRIISKMTREVNRHAGMEKRLCREQPETLQELGKGTYIQRRNITPYERKDGNGEADKGYSCEYRILTKEEYFAALEQENSNKNMLTSMAAQADIYEKLIETEKNQLVIMQAIADLYEKENGGV